MVARGGTRAWVLRVAINSKRRHIGLGPLSEVTLAAARDRALVLKNEIRAGGDPLATRRTAKAQAALEAVRGKTFDDCAALYIDAHESSWRNAKHSSQWRNTLNTYASPVIGQIPVASVDRSHVLAVLQPIWQSKTETASRLRSRIELVLSYAVQAGYREDGPNPARWRGGMDRLLPAPSKVAKVQHHRAIPVVDIPAFWQALVKQSGVGAKALAFALLTAARSGEVRGATWTEVLDTPTGPVWAIPAARMKAGREHRVPLSPAAVALLGERGEPDALLFTANGKPLSDATLLMVLRRMGVDAVPHGLRSSFRDWCANTGKPRELAEAALAHTVGGVEGAYFRSDVLELRRELMNEWAEYVQVAK
jgi:integrase